jgi:AAA domain/Primase C terminal 2 (PriCT-2)/Bifunctional DNA primase/polymerase, N-terminal
MSNVANEAPAGKGARKPSPYTPPTPYVRPAEATLSDAKGNGATTANLNTEDLAWRVLGGSGDELADRRVHLLVNGYVPLPADGKGSLPPGWSKLDEEGNQRGIQPTVEVIDRWSVQYPNWHSTSVRCGDVVALDCDILDTAVADKVRAEARRVFGTAFPTRVGRPPKFIMLARAKEPFRKLMTGKYAQPDGGESRVEALGNGQQFIAFGIHPGTGKPYEWFGGDPLSVPVTNLPEVSRDQVVEFLRAAEGILSSQPGWSSDPKARANYDESGREEHQRDYAGEPTDWAKLERALDKLTEVGDYDTFYRIVAALKDGTDSPKRALALAFRWASQYPDLFDPVGLKKKWDSFRRGTGVGLGTIFHLAREAEAGNRDASGFMAGEIAECSGAGALETAAASSFKMRGIRWLWPNRFAIGKLGLIGGLPDKGKGLISCDVIACVTADKSLPCREGQTPQGSVIWLTAEDDIEDTIIPRLVAAGADLDRVHIVKMMRDAGKRRMFNLTTDLEALRAKIDEIGDVVLVIIDPVSAYVGVGKVNNSMTTDVRGFLTPLTDLAAEMRLSVLGIMHFNKKADVTNAMLRIADSLAYVAAARHRLRGR